MGFKEILVLVFLAFSLLVSKNDGVEGERKREDMELERQLKILNKPAVKTIKTEEGDTYDCIDFYKQPAFDHPLLKKDTIKDDKLDGDWLLAIEDDYKILGLWPNELFTSLRDGASEVHFGGQSYSNKGGKSGAPMGSGYYGYRGDKEASYFAEAQVANATWALTFGNLDEGRYQISKYNDDWCCDLTDRGNRGQKWGYTFFYGGPGRNCREEQ